MTGMELAGSIIFGVILFVCILAAIKNQINYSIRMKWLDEVYDNQDWIKYHSKFQLYCYDETFKDMKLWWYVPFKDYLKSKEEKLQCQD